MPTLNPRINVTLSPSLYGMVETLAKHQRVSRAMVLRELLEASEPALAQVVAMMDAAENMSKAAKARMLQDMEQTMVKLDNGKDQALALAAGITADLVAQAESIQGRRPGPQPARNAGGLGTRATGAVEKSALRPPSSNRGVKSSDNTIKTIAKGQATSRAKPVKVGLKTRGVN